MGFRDRNFGPATKGAPLSVNPSAPRGRSGWYRSTVAVSRWEFGSQAPLREKLRLRKPRSPKSRSLDPRSSAAKAQTHNRRPRLQLRSAARAVRIARYRPHRAVSQEQQAPALRRRQKAQTPQTLLDYRTNQRPAWQFRRLLVRHEHLLATYRSHTTHQKDPG
jgi:hypothetical protein